MTWKHWSQNPEGLQKWEDRAAGGAGAFTVAGFWSGSSILFAPGIVLWIVTAVLYLASLFFGRPRVPRKDFSQ